MFLAELSWDKADTHACIKPLQKIQSKLSPMLIYFQKIPLSYLEPDERAGRVIGDVWITAPTIWQPAAGLPQDFVRSWLNSLFSTWSASRSHCMILLRSTCDGVTVQLTVCWLLAAEALRGEWGCLWCEPSLSWTFSPLCLWLFARIMFFYSIFTGNLMKV